MAGKLERQGHRDLTLIPGEGREQLALRGALC